MKKPRFPFPVPFGWYQVGFADAITRAEIKPLRFFGRDLVLWRSASGTLHLQDAHCPHLGANFSVGGRVVGENIQCPLHQWQFDGVGSVASIPHASRNTANACVRHYPLQIRHGLIMAWYHPHGAPASFNLPVVPAFDDPDFVPPLVTRHEIATCLQEMGENAADSAHFLTVHQHLAPARYDRFDFEGASMIMESRQTFPSSGGPVAGYLNSTSFGFGWAVVRYRTVIDVCMLTTLTPIDKERVVQYFHVSYKNPERDARVDRIGAAFNQEVNRQLTDDMRIWEHKIYLPDPVLCDGDGPIARYRKWARQFYTETPR